MTARWALLTMLVACAPPDGSRVPVGDSSQVGSLQATHEVPPRFARVDVRVLDSAGRPVPNATLYTDRSGLKLVMVERRADGQIRWEAEERLQLTDRDGWWRGQVVSPPLVADTSSTDEVKLTAYQLLPPDNRVSKGSVRVKLDFALDSSVREIPKVVLRLNR
ncbi:MAG: hypothetical protein K2R93_20940 [Gemmatimonadaceae bacterium]|nr:hypothetical protein [Gemmatimonadaceae bacterium]